MFCVFNKQKIYSYLIAASAAVVLFVLSFFLTKTDLKTIQASSNINAGVPIYNVETTSKRISISINCAWS